MDVKLQGREAAGKIPTLFLVFEVESGVFILPQFKLGGIPFLGRGLRVLLLSRNFRITFQVSKNIWIFQKTAFSYLLILLLKQFTFFL